MREHRPSYQRPNCIPKLGTAVRNKKKPPVGGNPLRRSITCLLVGLGAGVLGWVEIGRVEMEMSLRRVIQCAVYVRHFRLSIVGPHTAE